MVFARNHRNKHTRLKLNSSSFRLLDRFVNRPIFSFRFSSS